MWKLLKNLREKYLNLHIQDAIDHEKFSMISIIYHSTKIEGCALSETDTKVLIENNLTAAGKPLTDHLMVKDHYESFLFIKQAALEKRQLDTGFIKEVNALVMKHTGGIVKTILGNFDTSQGDLRLLQVYVGKKYFPDFKKVSGLLEKMCDQINQQLYKIRDSASGNDILNCASDLHYHFINIHPFGDGNGRTSRLLMNYIQMLYQEPLIKIFTEDRAAYIDALNEAEEKEDLSIFQNFVCGQQIKFYQAEIEKYEKMNTPSLG